MLIYNNYLMYLLLFLFLCLFLQRFNVLLKCSSRMELKKEIRILGRRFKVEPRAKESLKGITVGEKLSYRFYGGTYQGTPLLFVEPKNGNPSPRTLPSVRPHLHRGPSPHRHDEALGKEDVGSGTC